MRIAVTFLLAAAALQTPVAPAQQDRDLLVTPDGVPSIFVRAIWRAAGRQAFATALWLRADTGEILWKNLRPASWIGMHVFHSGLVQEQLGLVLNVVDSNGDGWAEIVFAQVGYEGVGISLLDVRSDFTPVGAGYSYGC